jgi:hypothetical protein
MTDTRGKITHRARAAQLRDYSGIVWGAAHPSDIDCIMELNGQAFAIVELKLQGAGIPTGQRLLLANLIDTLMAGGAAAVGMIAEHNTMNCSTDIPTASARVVEMRFNKPNFLSFVDKRSVASARVVEMRFNKGWHITTKPHTVREIMERFFQAYAPEQLARLEGKTGAHNTLHGATGGQGDTTHRHEIETPHRAKETDE